MTLFTGFCSSFIVPNEAMVTNNYQGVVQNYWRLGVIFVSNLKYPHYSKAAATNINFDLLSRFMIMCDFLPVLRRPSLCSEFYINCQHGLQPFGDMFVTPKFQCSGTVLNIMM